jgi:hypothetical protein
MLLVGMILLLPAKNKQNRPSVHNQPVRQLRFSTTLRPRLHDGPVRFSWKGADMPLAYIRGSAVGRNAANALVRLHRRNVSARKTSQSAT